MARQRPVEAPVVVASEGLMPSVTEEHVRERLGHLLEHAHEPVLAVRVRLTHHEDPAVSLPYVAQANVDVNGRLVRAQARAATDLEAVDRLEDRLRSRLERTARHWEARRGGLPVDEPHEWRHESLHASPREWSPGGRTIHRRKMVGPRRCGVDEAAHDLTRLDYEAHLFVEAGTHRDSILSRGEGGGFVLQQGTPPDPQDLAPHELDLTISSHLAPRITPDEAAERLDQLGLPFLFFVDPTTRRGALLYRRYDGHYGLVSPSE